MYGFTYARRYLLLLCTHADLNSRTERKKLLNSKAEVHIFRDILKLLIDETQSYLSLFKNPWKPRNRR